MIVQHLLCAFTSWSIGSSCFICIRRNHPVSKASPLLSTAPISCAFLALLPSACQELDRKDTVLQHIQYIFWQLCQRLVPQRFPKLRSYSPPYKHGLLPPEVHLPVSSLPVTLASAAASVKLFLCILFHSSCAGPHCIRCSTAKSPPRCLMFASQTSCMVVPPRRTAK